MLRSRYLLPLLLPWLAAASPLPDNTNLEPTTDATTHANHIFNAVHNSMRQFGSSLNHNGMSLFIATVPEGTELYHGTSTKDRVNGTQWLAFEPEHALIFARDRRGPPPGHPPGDGQGPPHDRPLGGSYQSEEVASLPKPADGDENKQHHLPEDRPRHGDGIDGKGHPGKTHSDKGCHGPPSERLHYDPPRRCPPGEGHLPCPGPSGENYRGPPHRGPPGHHEHPPEWFEHDDKPLDEDRVHHEHHGLPPPHKSSNHRGHDHPKHQESSLPPIGYWVHRLGDLLRNPKRRHAPPPHEAASDLVQPEMIETRAEQEPLAPDNPEDQSSGYLHTYRTRHSLRLLYVDGQSAAKSNKGTLDTQDVLLLENSIDHDSGMFGERERAAQLCKLAHEKWDHRVDGILRMEGGFEIILCDFVAHLDVVSIAKANPKAGGGFGGGNDNGDGFNYYRAVAARYHDIGGGRVVLDYKDFVSAFAYPEAMIFDDTGRPRLNNESAAIDDMRRAVDKMVLRKSDESETVNWQAIADMVVARYADRIEYLASGSLKSLEALQSEIERALRPFIDYSVRNSSAEVERCASQFMPSHVSSTSTNVAAQAIRQVTNTLCSSLETALEQTDYDKALDQIKQLKEYLAWTTWKQCRGCAVDEICFLPIWPVGTAEDFEQPKCRSDVNLGPGHGGSYWSDFGGPGHKGPGPQKRRRGVQGDL